MNDSDAASKAATLEPAAVFDASVLGAMFGDEAAVIASVLQTFMVATGGSLDELTAAIARGDMAAVAGVAHRITGAARMSGAHALGHTARSVEVAAKEGAQTTVEHRLGDLNAQWLLLQAAINSK